MKMPRITFGIIVLNGEPFTKYCLRSIYPFAHEIIVVEGACEGADSISNEKGHSIDGTLESLREFKDNEDNRHILTIVTHDGFWSEKDEQSVEYAKRATGDYLWQVDIDEFYRESDMIKTIGFLCSNPDVTAISFHQITFWGSPKYSCDSWRLRQFASQCHRVFKWKKGYKYSSHRPPTVTDENGRDLRTIKWINANTTETLGIYLFHYSLLLPVQVKMKGLYYSNSPLLKRTGWNNWMENSYISLKKPFRVHNMYEKPSWLEKYSGDHPIQLNKMWEDISTGVLSYNIRNNNDVELLLSSHLYKLRRAILKFWFPIDTFIRTQVINRILWHVNNFGKR